MSPTSPSHDTTTLGKPLTSEDEIDKRRNNDDYKREKRFKDFILIIAMVLITFLTAGFIFAYFSDTTTRDFVLSLIKQNAVGIVFFVLFLLGVNMQKDKKS
jgi:hypothetical protein